MAFNNEPRRFKFPIKKHPNGSDSKFRYGCYFPLTNLCVYDMGERRTMKPIADDIEWLDDIRDLPS